MGPYGVKFEEVDSVRRAENKQNLRDLEYLINLKQHRHGDMSEKEWESYNRKIRYMNDRYAYGEMDRMNFLRGMMKGYEDEYLLRKEDKKRMKELENEEDRKRLIDVGALERAEKAKEAAKQAKLHNDQMLDLDNFNKKKAAENKKKDEENKKLLGMMDKMSDQWDIPLANFQDKLKGNNNRIYANAGKYNDLLGGPIDPRAFNAKDDCEFNRIIAEQRARERRDKKLNPEGLKERLQANDDLLDQKRKDLADKLNKEKLYKQYLDNQNELDRLNKMKNAGEDTRPQLLMPAYFYPNLPIPLYHKARDGILASKSNEKYFGKDMNKFFKGDAQISTLVDYGSSTGYLGDSKLRHNPITCPVNDYYYNKYVNNLKKNAEYIPRGRGYYDEQFNGKNENNNGNYSHFRPNSNDKYLMNKSSNYPGTFSQNGQQIIN